MEGHPTQPEDEEAGGGGKKVTPSRSLKAETKNNSDTGCICIYIIHVGFEPHRIKISEVPLSLLCKTKANAKITIGLMLQALFCSVLFANKYYSTNEYNRPCPLEKTQHTFSTVICEGSLSVSCAATCLHKWKSWSPEKRGAFTEAGKYRSEVQIWGVPRVPQALRALAWEWPCVLGTQPGLRARG